MESQDPTGGGPGSAPGVVTSVPCPACGVAVAVGYPRCPKCHAPVPQPRRARRQTAREGLAGGTSVEPERAGLGGWLVIAAVVVAAIGLVVYVATRDDDRAAPAARDDEGVAPGDDDGDGAGAVDDEAPTEGGEGDDEPFRPRTPAGQPLRDAVRALDADLRAERVWSKVVTEGDVVIVESAMCADAAMPPVLNAHLADLAAGGAVTLRCQEPHGAVVFATDL
jgi:hypothetical protein